MLTSTVDTQVYNERYRECGRQRRPWRQYLHTGGQLLAVIGKVAG